MKIGLVVLFLLFKGLNCQIFENELILTSDRNGTAFEDIQDNYIQQILSHLNNGAQKPPSWSQRYFVNEEFWSGCGKEKKNPPIFLKIGGANQIYKGWMRGGFWFELGKKHCALLFQLEHRFYGKSRPTEDVSMDNLYLLHSREAIGDIKVFIETMTTKYKLTKENKWYTFGGGYAGNLVAWSKFILPDLIAGGISSSPALLAVNSFYQYYQEMRKTLNSHAPKCGDRVMEAIAEVESVFTSNSDVEIHRCLKTFNVCSEFVYYHQENTDLFYQTILNSVARAVQYNEIGLWTEKMNLVCSIMNNPYIETMRERLAIVSNTITRECIQGDHWTDVKHYQKDKWNDDVVVTGKRQWHHQLCNEFGDFQTFNMTDLDVQILDREYFVTRCYDIFGRKFISLSMESYVKSTNNRYKGINISVKNIIFVLGLADPWHTLSNIKSTSSSPVISIHGGAHTQDMNDRLPRDSLELRRARIQIEKAFNKIISSSS